MTVNLRDIHDAQDALRKLLIAASNAGQTAVAGRLWEAIVNLDEAAREWHLAKLYERRTIQ